MARFRYIARKSDGETVSGMTEGDTEAVAIGKLQEMGFFPMSVEPMEEKQALAKSWRFWKRVRAAEVTVFTRQLADLLGYGF